MSNAAKLAALPLQIPRFGVIQGGRSTSMAARPSSEGPTTSKSAPRVRNLFLVTRENAPAIATNSLTQAHRIVAQVEWEIQQQAARERTLRLRTWAPALAVPTSSPFRSQHTTSGLDRFLHRVTRFFAL